MESILNHYHTFACGGHFGGQRQLQRYFNRDSISLACSGMLTSLCLPVVNVKEWEHIKMG